MSTNEHLHQSSLDTQLTQPVNELVPLSQQREAWNLLHGTHLPEHNDALTHQQAKRINDSFDIEINYGTHGTEHARPTQVEYAAAKGVVDGLEHGDTLFVENRGYSEPEFEPIKAGATPVQIDAATAQLEKMKDNYQVNAWTYAVQLARLKGVTVVNADQDAFEVARTNEISGGRTLLEVRAARHTNPEDKALLERVYTARVQKARNVVKDKALEQLPPEGSTPKDRKPKLAVLFGAGGKHPEELKEAFAGVGLAARMNKMKSTEDQQQRTAELSGFLMLKTLQAPGMADAVAGIAKNFPRKTGRETR